ncbi:MAG: RNA 3'-phosphate cyclase, partial [Deltaproteobacteria bacterium]|nr:RNA 3'-phosphate cyclase [Deltaproteobacteria bacterium]
GRTNPGLRAQHLAGVQALADICHAAVKVLQLGSQKIIFKPREVTGGELLIDIGTAGAIGLILQTLMLPAIKAPSPLRLRIIGGTDVPWAPTAGYLMEVALPLLGKMAYQGKMVVTKRGYFPRGGGEVLAELKRASLFPLKLLDRGSVQIIKGRSHASEALRARRVAERQREGAIKVLERYDCPYDIEVEYGPAVSPGSGIDLWALSEGIVLGSNALGARGKRAQEVGAEAASALLRQISSGAALDEWMGDQILPFLTVVKGESIISVPRITDHLRTNLWVIGQFMPIASRIREEKDRAVISVTPSS